MIVNYSCNSTIRDKKFLDYHRLHGLFLGHPVKKRKEKREKEILQHKIALTDIGIAAEVSGGSVHISLCVM